MEQVAESFVSAKRQINSLASVALQNRRALDLLTTEKGGTCLFLGEYCCYFVNETGIVKGRIKELRDRIERCKKELQNLYTPQNLFQQALPWLLPFLRPLVLNLFLLFGLCLLNLFQRFLQQRIRAMSRDQVKTVLLLETRMARIKKQHYKPWTSFLPDYKPLTLIYQHEEALNINSANISFSFYIYSLRSGMKESCMAQGSPELKLPSRSSPPF